MKQKSEVAVIDFTKFDIQQLPELHGKKEEIKKLIKANPIVKITDNASYELAKKSRTAVKTLRTSLEKEKKEVNDRIKKSVLEVVANEYDSLITSVRSDENARQEEVTAWEEIKENEHLEKLRLEQERVEMIKFKISDFHSEWSQRISQLDFANIEEFEDKLTKVVADYDTSSLAEFEVLFLDNWVRLSHALSEKKSTLLAQENIRLEQIKLAEEREKQRLEAEKLQAEQKRVAEEQRIAQENFLREKREFEEKQDEAKFQERCKQLTDFGCEFEPKLNGYYKVGYFIHSDDVKSADSELWERELQDAKDAYKNDLLDANKIVGASFLSDEESAKEKWSKAITEKNYISDYPELDVDPKGVMQTQEVEFEENIYIGNYKNITETFASFELIFLIADLPKFENMTLKELLAPYNIPTRKTNE